MISLPMKLSVLSATVIFLGCTNQVIANADEWDVLIGNVDDYQLVVRVPAGIMRSPKKVQNVSQASLGDSSTLFTVLYGRGGGVANKPYPFDISVRLVALDEGVSGGSITGVLQTLRTALSSFRTVGDDSVVVLADREWVELSSAHAGSYSSAFSDRYYLNIIYSFDAGTENDTEWRAQWEAIAREVAREVTITIH